MKILVTGATGFIGSRLCERLKLYYQLPFRAMVRNFTNAHRIARLDIEMVYGDLQNKESIGSALRGCDSVMHLAHGDPGSAPEETKNLLSAALMAKIKRFVHVSSMAVHGPSPGPECAHEETAIIGKYGEPYSDSKAEVEKLVHRACKGEGLPAVILRPTIVYGPYGPFVIDVIANARQGKISLIDEGRGICNAVYVDDVCDAIHAALRCDEAVGKALLITADRAVSWSEFNLTFAQMAQPAPKVENFSSPEVRRYWEAQLPGLRTDLRAFSNLLISSDFHDQLSKVPSLRAAIIGTKRIITKHLAPQTVFTLRSHYQKPSSPSPSAHRNWPNRGRVVREAFHLEFSNSRAKELLNWKPAYDFEEGAEITRTWLSFARLLPSEQDWAVQ